MMKALLILIFLTIAFSLSSFAQCLNVSSTYTDVNCLGGADGSITLTPTSGQAPYTYSWGSGTNTTSSAYTINNLAAGIYIVTVVDNLGCDMFRTIVITEPSGLQINTSITSNYNGADISCHSSCDGEGVVTASGGTPGYFYLWSDGSTNSTITGMCAGTYYLTVTDANACFATSSLVITAPSDLLASVIQQTNVSCNGACDATATITGSGGAGTYIYLWPASANSQTGATATNLCAGTYCPTITDINGCTDSVCITISEPSPITGGISINSGITCSGTATGSLGVNLSGGTPSVLSGYSYNWATGAITPTISNLSAGNYCVTVTDSLGCIWTDCIVLSDPNLNLSIISSNDVSCNGICDGSFTIGASGGSGPYTFSNNGGITFSNTTVYNNLCAAKYIIDVLDANGCTSRDSVLIASPSPLDVQILVQDTVCQGNSSGSLLGVVSGGIPGYTYVWSHATVNNPTTYLASGSYCVTVSDANGCSAVDCSIVDTLNFEVNITNAIVSGNQKYGISDPNNPQSIQTASSYPNQTTYNWFPATGLSCSTCPNPTVSVLVPTQYILNANHTTLGCTSSDTIIIYPYSIDTIRLELAPDSSINYCSNYPPFFTGASSTAIGNLSYGSLLPGASGCFDYTSNGTQGIDTILWVDCATLNIGVLPVNVCDTTVIYITTASCVWPGDTDNDGIANNFDLLPIGQHHGTSGLTRINANTNYTCQPAIDWGATISGLPTVDLKHVDADGNAIINSMDTNAIILNWTQTHLRNNSSFLTGVDLYVDTTTTNPGDTVRLPIILGNTNVPNAYGIAFTLNYDPTGIDTNTVKIDFDNSWLGAINSNMIGIHKDFYHQGQTEVALTRINQTAATGSGAIAHINFTIKDDVLPKSAFLRLDFDITDIRFIDSTGTIIPTTGIPTQILVTDGLTSTGIVLSKQKNILTAFPNPTSGQVQIQSLVEEIETVLLYNLTGTLLYQKEDINSLNTKLDLKSLPKGIYMANVISNKGVQTLRIVKQ